MIRVWASHRLQALPLAAAVKLLEDQAPDPQSAVYNDLHHSQLVDRLIMEADQDDDNDEDDEDDEEEEDDDDGPLSRSRQSRIYL